MTEYEKNMIEQIRKAAAEGVVLLENDGTLPLLADKRKIALYGAGAVLTVKGGTGSGDVRVQHVISIREALEESGFTVTTGEWLDDYIQRNEAAENARFAHMKKEAEKTGDPLMSVFLRNPQVLVDGADIPIQPVKNSEETAVYVISRISGESADRNAVEGDYYLTKAERRQIEVLAKNYEHVVIVLNTGGVIDTGFYREIEGLSAMIVISQAGVACGAVLADVLSGESVPSGKLTVTWAKEYQDYPASGKFRDNSVNEKYYEEGIFVGYRYFDTFHVEPAYPFGYGKSYTEFAWKITGAEADEKEVRLEAEITNTGDAYSGKEVLQVYTGGPEGELEKPYQELRTFAKTGLLAPGGKEKLRLSFKVSEMASYSEAKAAYILEPGEYIVRAGTSSRDTQVVLRLKLDKTVVTEQLRNRLSAAKDPERQHVGGKYAGSCWEDGEGEAKIPTVLLRAEKFPTPVCPYRERKESVEKGNPIQEAETVFCEDGSCYEGVKEGKISAEQLTACFNTEELASLCVGAGAIGNGAVIGSAAIKVPGAAGETTSGLAKKWGVPTAVLADGPAGLRLISKYQIRNSDGSVVVPPNGFLALTGFERLAGEQPAEEDCHEIEQKTTAIPIGSMMAQTWNPKVIREMGKIVSGEMQQYKVNLWLAPAINIQRDPLCGRNFEYYSEDPFLAGACAAAMTEGIQETPGCGVTVKHFAANSQEENRFDQNSIISERTLREIYLRAFEIVVKQAQPMMLMTAYNLINGVHAANSRELLKDILRTEWKFEGAVVTDWGTTKNGMRAGFGGKTRSLPERCMYAGNDLIMPGDPKDRKEITEAVEVGRLNLADLRTCAANIIRTQIRLGL
ncbi:glycoside hydrolase family 3 protein [Mediterraneibacter gnavus]|uniref:glycoside hydrolase family 3 protein n=1 Tax=Mediterraneibacter gnavus TaxID=33038 RepID=UPI00232E16DE|nr:glycoside hydrolase family 3 protein [Mediterraneibacter gnavus]MDB8711056.1 glycoside hydrolase family 3 N-terminal domain-containing protein [Mediterraneibacter gnavus]MDB8714332.1 glycoside hydrolase family 3 N-terminal domain-containing protein [Mediterraneibacter gnavus]